MKKRYTEKQIITAIKEPEVGAKVDDICRRLGIYSGTFYNWRSKYAGLEVNEAKRLRELEIENNKLKKTSGREDVGGRSDEGCAVKKVVKPVSRKQAAGQSAYGYLLLHGILKAEGLVTNKKRTHRIYTEEGLQVRTRKRKKIQRPRQPMEVSFKTNQRWLMDFVSDQLSHGRRFRVLNVVDDYSREMVGQLVSVSISGQQVAQFLTQLIEQRDKPSRIICDNGTEFTSKAMFFWSKESGIELGFIQPGKPTQNAFVESLNGKFRNECLNQHWFRSLEEARVEIDAWRHQYNHVRPHSSLNYLPPVVFAQQAA